MGFYTKKIVEYRASCDHCGKESPEVHRSGNEWDHNKWPALRGVLQKKGWVFIKRDEMKDHGGRSHSLYDIYCCQDCCDKERLVREHKAATLDRLPRNNGEVGYLTPGGDPICYCGSGMVLRDATAKGFGTFYGCAQYPRCDGLVGAHKDDDRPLGLAAPKWVRQLRHELHDEFDVLWKNYGPMSRAAAYEWLAGELNISSDECHIAMFDSETCARAMEAVARKVAEIRNPSATLDDKKLLRDRLEQKAREFRAAKKRSAEPAKVAESMVDELPSDDDVPF